MERRALLDMFSFGKKPREAEPVPKRWVMVVDVRRCVGCQACTVACAMENRTPLGEFRTSVGDFEVQGANGPRKALLPTLCNHCENPPCVPVCPVGATFQRADGLVLVNQHRCIGCGYCVLNCPYSARFMNHVSRSVDKCTLCSQRLDAGLLPACVETCLGKARIVGDANDPESMVSKLLAANPHTELKPEAGTKPHVHYIGLSEGASLPVADPGLAREARVTEETFR